MAHLPETAECWKRRVGSDSCCINASLNMADGYYTPFLQKKLHFFMLLTIIQLLYRRNFFIVSAGETELLYIYYKISELVAISPKNSLLVMTSSGFVESPSYPENALYF